MWQQFVFRFAGGSARHFTAALLVLLLLLHLPARASLDGEYVAQGNKGPVTLTLKSQGGRVTGSLRNSGVNFAVVARVEATGVIGEVQGKTPAERLYIEAMPLPQGDGLAVLLAAIGADGQPDAATEQLLEFRRTGAPTPAAGGATRLQQRLQGQAAAAGAAPGAVDAALAATPQDRQIAQFLLSSAWCHYSYSGGSLGGTERNERVVFDAAGNIVSSSSSESSYSGGNRNQYGQQTQAWGAHGNQGGGERGRWRVRQGMVQLSEDGNQWQPLPMQVTQNSNGHPIIQANGKEYARCN